MINILITLGVVIFALLFSWMISGESLIFNDHPALILLFGLSFLIQWIAYIPSVTLKTEKFYDLTGSITYITVMLISIYLASLFNALSITKIIIAGAIIIWALRLGSFLFMRIHKAGEDKRFADIKVNPPRLLMTWTLQGLWVCICSASALVALTSSMVLDISTIFIAGLALFIIGFLLEVIADNQKTKFNSLPENKDKFINVGLWSRSRHPNYFGEFLIWAGISIMSVEYMSGLSYAALISPVFSYLLINYVSGVRMLENKARKKWGHLDSYKEYLAKTPKFMPKLF